MEYTVKDNETIVDVCINATGTIVSWEEIIKNYDSWTPSLTNGRGVTTPPIYNDVIQKDSSQRPNSNFGIYDFQDKVDSISSILDSVVASVFAEPVIDSSVEYYYLKTGETITDVILNLTGDISNWDPLLQSNLSNTWTPQESRLVISSKAIQKNVVSELSKRPLCNNSGINDLDAKIQDIINNFANSWILKTGYWDDNGYWFDSELWID
jgi:hypothetical protein